MGEAVRTVLAVVVGMLAVTGLVIVLDKVGEIVTKKIGLDISDETDDRFMIVLYYSTMGLAAVAVLALLVYLLYGIGTVMIFPVFGIKGE